METTPRILLWEVPNISLRTPSRVLESFIPEAILSRPLVNPIEMAYSQTQRTSDNAFVIR